MSSIIDTAIARQSDVYRSADFRRRVFEHVGQDPSDVAICTDALLAAGRIPTPAPAMPEEAAVWADAASLLAAIAGRQRRPASVVRTATRICALKLQFDVGRRLAAGQPVPSATFGLALADLLRRAHAGTAPLPADAGPLVAVMWSEGGAALFATIDLSGSGGGKRLYSDVRLPAPPDGDWDFVRLPTVGGSLFSSSSIAGLGGVFGAAPSLAAAHARKERS
ncbi:MAG: hypothetical protein GY844_11480 [Bradyrhizobium sp.]|mgnify:CR=1 FL=1|uniref:hypothetical protein n=1 Tax=Bosea sp. (in: a-proteobacteria) TaxID=1871050 RepID=UPI00238788F7|nr:hypothetical protein [Bradyrhizobium sp.]MCP4739168.1 hypothetical protein [Bosea sp. (in: a-proteobacteria)]